MNGIKTKVAAGSTLLALGVLAAFALGSGGEGASADSAGQPTEVRTQTIRRTVRVRRDGGQNRGPGVSGGGGSAPTAAAPLAAPAAPAAPAARPSAAPPPAPVTTRTSGSDDHGGDDDFD